jgi:NADP-dependent 3-hydroxy acid dehydrogenase YdfG
MENKVIVITGAGSGVGRDCAKLFLEKGWQVALLGRRIAPLEETAQSHENRWWYHAMCQIFKPLKLLLER